MILGLLSANSNIVVLVLKGLIFDTTARALATRHRQPHHEASTRSSVSSGGEQGNPQDRDFTQFLAFLSAPQSPPDLSPQALRAGDEHCLRPATEDRTEEEPPAALHLKSCHCGIRQSSHGPHFDRGGFLNTNRDDLG